MLIYVLLCGKDDNTHNVFQVPNRFISTLKYSFIDVQRMCVSTVTRELQVSREFKKKKKNSGTNNVSTHPLLKLTLLFHHGERFS